MEVGPALCWQRPAEMSKNKSTKVPAVGRKLEEIMQPICVHGSSVTLVPKDVKQRKAQNRSMEVGPALCWQRHANMSKKEITNASSGGTEPTGRRKANLRTWVQRHAALYFSAKQGILELIIL